LRKTDFSWRVIFPSNRQLGKIRSNKLLVIMSMRRIFLYFLNLIWLQKCMLGNFTTIGTFRNQRGFLLYKCHFWICWIQHGNFDPNYCSDWFSKRRNDCRFNGIDGENGPKITNGLWIRNYDLFVSLFFKILICVPKNWIRVQNRNFDQRSKFSHTVETFNQNFDFGPEFWDQNRK